MSGKLYNEIGNILNIQRGYYDRFGKSIGNLRNSRSWRDLAIRWREFIDRLSGGRKLQGAGRLDNLTDFSWVDDLGIGKKAGRSGRERFTAGVMSTVTDY